MIAEPGLLQKDHAGVRRNEAMMAHASRNADDTEAVFQGSDLACNSLPTPDHEGHTPGGDGWRRMKTSGEISKRYKNIWNHSKSKY